MQEQSPYAAPTAIVEDAPSNELRLGGRGERLVAVIIDTIIQIILTMIVLIPVVLVTGAWQSFMNMAMQGQSMPYTWTLGLSGMGIVIFVLVQGYPLAATGQTWGKRLLKLRIVDLEGRKPEFWKMLGLRYGVGWIASLIPVLGTLYALVDVLFIFREDQRCIHDHIAGTRVVVAE